MFINGLFWSGRRQKLNVYILMSSRREMCTLSVSNMIYHKFSHGAAFYMLNGKNVNVMLEFLITWNVFFLQNNPQYVNQSKQS